MLCLQKDQVSPVSQPMAQMMMQRTVKTKRHRNKLQGESAPLPTKSCWHPGDCSCSIQACHAAAVKPQGCLWRPDTQGRQPVIRSQSPLHSLGWPQALHKGIPMEALLCLLQRPWIAFSER